MTLSSMQVQGYLGTVPVWTSLKMAGKLFLEPLSPFSVLPLFLFFVTALKLPIFCQNCIFFLVDPRYLTP